MRTPQFLALALLSVSGALGAASCAQSPPATPDVQAAGGVVIETSAPDVETSAPDVELNFTPAEPAEDGPTGEAREEWLTLVMRVTCQLAAVLITELVCHKKDFWETHCPEGTYITVHDVKPSTAIVKVSCDTLKELTCGSGAYFADKVATLVACGRILR